MINNHSESNRKFWGGLLTVFYLTGIAIYLILNWERFTALDPNNLGDFVAGAAAPLAFLWLVLGYFQQGDELKANTEALLMQQEEMTKLVENAEFDSYYYRLSMQPNFEFTCNLLSEYHAAGADNPFYWVLSLAFNVEGEGTVFKVTCNNDELELDSDHTLVVDDDRWRIRYTYDDNLHAYLSNAPIKVYYTDMFGMTAILNLALILPGSVQIEGQTTSVEYGVPRIRLLFDGDKAN